MGRRFYQIACLALWVGLLIVGLWPFHFFPNNKVEWLRDKNGLHFEDYGQVYGTTPWIASPTSKDGGFSVELCLQAPIEYPTYSSILTFDNPSQPADLAVAQSLSDLVIQSPSQSTGQSSSIPTKLYLDRAFEKNKPRFLTIVSADGPRTVLYLEGVAQKSSDGLVLTARSLSGMLLLGHGANGNEPWSGDVLGLAIYDRALTAGEVSQHYRTWMEGNAASLSVDPGIAGFYLFNERGGRTIHNQAGRMPELIVPRIFRRLHGNILEVPAEFTRSDLADGVINILGFTPFGFCLMVLLRQSGFSTRRAFILALLIGGGTSLTIEVLQVFLPSRDSSLLDLINNILGTGLGAMVQLYWQRKASLPHHSS